MQNNDDLQEQLAKPKKPTYRLARISGVKGIGTIHLDTGLSNVLNLEKPEPKSPSDISQWLVRPNNVFMSASTTIEELPSGVYDIQMDPNGNIFFSLKSIITDDLIHLSDSNSDKVVNGIKKFWTKKQQYRERGVIYKRGVLLWGPPGSGKTVTLTLLMKELVEQGGTVFMVKNPDLVQAGLEQFRSIEPERPIILVFEDIDEIIRKYGEHEILAILDGENQTDNLVSIATTNYPEELGARIVNRPSRFDEVIKIDMPNAAARREYFMHILKDTDDFPLERAMQDTDRLSISHLKELVIAVTCLEQNYEDAIKRLKTMKTPPKSSEFDSGVGFK